MPGAPRTFTSRGRPSVCAPCQIVEESLDLRLASDERPPRDRVARRRLLSGHDPDGNGLGLALGRERLPFLGTRRGGRGAERRLPDGDAVDRRGALETGGGVHDVAGRHALAFDARADDDERRARVHRGPDVQVEPGVLLVECGDRARDRERRANGALGIVLVGDRCAEEGDDGVSDELLDVAAM